MLRIHKPPCVRVRRGVSGLRVHEVSGWHAVQGARALGCVCHALYAPDTTYTWCDRQRWSVRGLRSRDELARETHWKRWPVARCSSKPEHMRAAPLFRGIGDMINMSG